MSLTDSLPLSMRYSITGADSINSKTKLHRFDSTSASYNSASNNKILIPVAADSFIDTANSYLYCQITNNAVDAAGADKSSFCFNANSIIEKLEIAVSGSSGKVETIDRYNLFAVSDDLWNSGPAELVHLQATAGGNTPSYPESNALGFALSEGGAAGNALTVALKLKGAFLDAYYGKALPQGMPQFTIEITLADHKNAFVAAGAASPLTYTVDNVRFYAPCYNILDEGIMSSYAQQLSSSPTMWMGESVGTIINSIAAAGGKQVSQINASYRSLNALISIMRSTGDVGVSLNNGISRSTLNNITEFVYRIKGELFPSDSIEYSTTNVSRAYIENLKAWAHHGEARAKTTAVSLTQFNKIGTAAGSAGADTDGHGMMSLSLKRFNDERLVNVGMDTSGSSAPSTLEITFSASPAANDLTTLAKHDVMFVLQPNGVIQAAM